MESIENKINKINNLKLNKLDEKINLIKELNSDILKQKTYYEKILNNIEDIPINNKFNKLSINSLLDNFENSALENKLQIYKVVSNKIDL